MASEDCRSIETGPQRPISDGAERTRAIKVANVLESVRRARANSDAGATARIVRKLQGSPLAWLASRGRIHEKELRAAEDIMIAFLSPSRALVLRGCPMERPYQDDNVDTSGTSGDAERRCGAFVQYWSRRAKLGDPTLAIVVAIVVDQRPFSSIEEEIGIRSGQAASAVVAGLRDYAARAGWVDGGLAQQWMDSATAVFAPVTPG